LMTGCCLGEEGRRGTWGRSRAVFNSDVAAPIIERLFRAGGKKVRTILEEVATSKLIAALVTYQPIARRLERLRDLTDDPGAA